MDFGLLGLDSFVVGPTPSISSQHQQLLEGNPKFNNGSGSMKQERSDPVQEDEGTTIRSSKVAKCADDLSLLRSDNINSAAQPKQQMLSFSSNNDINNKIPEVSFITAKDVGFISDKNGLSFCQQTPSSAAPTYSRTPGFGTGNLNGGMHGSFTGIRGPFTPAQWIELEHQAMIYKYLTANVPVPPQLLIPIRKAIHSSGFPGFSVGSYPVHSYGWGPFHLGYSGSTDPEPGRCRRTDGKKWRCSRDAVPDQKYCERHINRGRHRSRKPVEGHNGQAASGPNAKVVPTMSAPVSSLVSPGGGASSSVAIAQHQIKGLQPNGSTNTIAESLHDQQGLTVMPSTINLKSKDSPYSIARQHTQLDDSLQSEFGVVSCDSLLNPSQKSSYLGCKSYNSMLEFNSQQIEDQYQLKHFMDNWSKDQSNPSAVPGHKDLKSDWTQLSMSIPMSTDFSSSSPNHEKASISPCRLSHEFDPSKMGLGVGTVVSETGNKQNAWLPITWGNATGGPLGEVLMNNAKNAAYKGEEWDGSPQLGSSPTGVLQKSTFVSLSNSSSGGSPRGDNKRTLEGPSHCDDLLAASAHASSASIPSV